MLPFTLVITVTRSTATVPTAVSPALVAPAGATRLTLRVSPVPMMLGMLAEILAPVWLVVTAQVLLASTADVGSLPAAAVVTVSEGVPAKEIWLIAFTAKVTVWICAPRSAAPPMTPIARRILVKRCALIALLQENRLETQSFIRLCSI